MLARYLIPVYCKINKWSIWCVSEMYLETRVEGLLSALVLVSPPCILRETRRQASVKGSSTKCIDELPFCSISEETNLRPCSSRVTQPARPDPLFRGLGPPESGGMYGTVRYQSASLAVFVADLPSSCPLLTRSSTRVLVFEGGRR
jgi:hypothetical protein